MSADLTPRERAARRLLGIAALEKLLAAEKAALRAEDGQAFTKAGQREVAELPDGTPLGNVRLDAAKPAWKVTDPDAWLDYVEEAAVQHILVRAVTEVSPAYTAAVLADLVPGSATFVDERTGELLEAPPGITWVAGSPRLVVTCAKGAPEAVRALLGAQGSALGLREVEAS